jgi:predicted transcriptional regulator
MTASEFLQSYQGAMSQDEFAKLLGVSQPLLSAIYNGKAKMGASILAGVIRAFPESRQSATDVFLAEKHQDIDEYINGRAK